MVKNTIKTYSTETFRDNFMQPVKQLDDLLKQNFGRYLIVRIEDMIQLMKLPVPPTKSTTHILMYLTEGFIEMTIGSSMYRIYENECLLVASGQVFSIGNVDVKSGKGYLIAFHPDFIIGKMGSRELLNDLEFLKVWGNPVIQLKNDAEASTSQLFKRMHTDYSANGLQHLLMQQAYFMALLAELNNAYQPLSDSPNQKSVVLSNRFKELLFSHIKTKHRVTDYAELLNITPNHLNKVVKQITGKSPTKWIDEALILEAKVLLHQTDYPINEVASAIGIMDPSYFSRLFKKYEGETPLEFRKMIEKS